MCLCVYRVQCHYFGLLDNTQQGANQIVQETDCVWLYLVEYLLLGCGVGHQVENGVFKGVVRKCDSQRLRYDYLELWTEQ